MSQMNRKLNLSAGPDISRRLSVQRRILSTGERKTCLVPASDMPPIVRLTGAVIAAEDAVAGTSLQAIMRARYPDLPVSLCADVREVHQRVVRSPDCLIIILLFLQPQGLMSRLRQLLWLRRRTRRLSWLLLYDGWSEPLPAQIFGMQVLPLCTSLVGLQKTLDRIMHCRPLAPTRLLQLTYRQWAVMRLLARGCRPGEVALKLGIAEKTVSIHRRDALRRLGLVRQHELLLLCVIKAMFPEMAQADEQLPVTAVASGHHRSN